MAKIVHLNHAFSHVFERESSQVEGQSLWQKDRKMRKRKGILISVHARARMLWNVMLVERPAAMLQMPF